MLTLWQEWKCIMNIGFIGAGKVGSSLGRYFAEGGYTLAGYADRDLQAAIEVAEFTHTKYYASYEELVEKSDMLMITVSDSAIASVWEQIQSLPLAGKWLCHTSGSLPSTIFSGIKKTGAYCYSIHPLYAIHSKWTSYKELSQAVFTIEGSKEKLEEVRQLFLGLGNQVETITPACKAKYHAAAVFASNYVTALANVTATLLQECGFSEEGAAKAYLPLMQGNVENICKDGLIGALTGPIERNDCSTIERHMACLEGDGRQLYVSLGRELLKVAGRKHLDSNYDEIKECFDKALEM